MIEKMVARDGIEPPTPAFSGLRSTNQSLPRFWVVAFLAPSFASSNDIPIVARHTSGTLKAPQAADLLSSRK